MLLATLIRPAGTRGAPAPAATRPPRRLPAVLLALLLAPSSPLPAASLDDAERARAEALARAAPWAGSRSGERSSMPGEVSGRAPTARAASHALGVQTLAVEEDPRKGAPPGERRARVYQHDHGTRLTRRVRVDLVAGTAIETRALASPHLPLNAVERQWALARLAAEDALLERLRDEQRRRGEPPFATLDALDVKASVFEPTDPAHACARERCALLSLFDASRTVFAVEPLVRFSDGTVTPLDDARAAR